MEITIQVCSLVCALLVAAEAQTLVQFGPAQGYSQHLPVAAGFAYAFHAPTASPKLFLGPKPYHAPVANTIVQPDIPINLHKTQYHSQDELGQYAYGYVHDAASHHEERTADGGVTGSFSYYDEYGNKQSANYRADELGFRVEATNLPVQGPSPTPEVAAATQAHLQAVHDAKTRASFGGQGHRYSGVSDTPEVAAAKAAHLKAYNEIRQRHSRRLKRSAHWPQTHRQTSYHSNQNFRPYAPPVPVGPTPAVQQATYEHLRAKDAAFRYGGNVHVGIADTPAVSAARDAHIYAYNKIAQDHARRWKRSTWGQYNNNYGGSVVQDDGLYRPDGREHQFDDGQYRHDGNKHRFDDGRLHSSGGANVVAYQAPQSHQAPSYQSSNHHQFNQAPGRHQFHQAPLTIPGVPTPAVQAATQAHLQAHHEAHTYGAHAHQGVRDTPEVEAAKAAHHHAFHQIKQDHARRWKRSAHYSPIPHVHSIPNVKYYHPNVIPNTPVVVKTTVVEPQPKILKQYHSQDEFGQYQFGYSGGPSAKHEERDANGVVRGGYSYVDANGILQTVNYEADDITGFKIISATNLPQH